MLLKYAQRVAQNNTNKIIKLLHEKINDTFVSISTRNIPQPEFIHLLKKNFNYKLSSFHSSSAVPPEIFSDIISNKIISKERIVTINQEARDRY